MTASLLARSVTVTRGGEKVLDSIDLTLAPGRRVGLLGPNGVGKSTLLRALAGTIELDGGSVEVQPPSARVGLLPQEPVRSETETVRAFLARRSGVDTVQQDLDDATHALAAGEDGADDRYSTALDAWMSIGAADFDARLEDMWSKLGLRARLLDQSTASLSGGEAARTSLASVLLSRFDVVLLDEPTNDLDVDGLELLEDWVIGLDAPVMVVSHDRTFLRRTITDVVEIDDHTRTAQWFAGGWDAFLAERELAKHHAQERYDEYARRRQGLVDRAQRQREWAAQGRSKLRKSGENDKFIRHFKMDQTEQLAGKAARTEKAIERLETVDKPFVGWDLRMSIPDRVRSGDIVSEARGAVVERGSFRLGPVDLTVAYGDRIALVGANGAGKSTLIDLLLGRIDPDDGTIRLGRSVIVGEVEQARTRLMGQDSLAHAFVDATAQLGARLSVGDARTLLAKFGLGADHVIRAVDTLSPGERTRAGLALLMAAGANLLVLDEPTNHLDLPAIEQLEQALETFDGTMILVTHDRSLLERVRITRWIDVVDGRCAER